MPTVDPFENAIEEFARTKDQRIIDRANAHYIKTNQVERELIRFRGEDADGNPTVYYRRFGSLTAQEGAEVLNAWGAKVEHAQNMFDETIAAIREKHGDEYADRMLAQYPDMKPKG